MQRPTPLAFLLAALLTISGAADAAAYTGMEFSRGKSEGWFFYNEPDEPVLVEPPADLAPTPQEVEQAEGPQGQAPGTVPMSAAWFREHFEAYQDRAVDNPTPENVRAFAYLQRVMMDKSQAFADAMQRVVLSDPLLDENTRMPLATFAAQRMTQEIAQNRRQVLQSISGRIGLMFFFDSQCPACLAQARILESVRRQLGFSILAVSVDGRPLPDGLFADYRVDQGQAHQLGVMVTPAIFAFMPPGDIQPVAQGSLSLADLSGRLLRQAHQAGWIDDATYAATRLAPPVGAVRPEGLTDAVLSDPVALVDYLQSVIGDPR